MSRSPSLSPPARVATFAGGLLFVGALGWGIIAYMTRLARDVGPWTADTGIRAIAVDALLFGAFAVHHSVFARPSVKHRVASLVSERLERTTYVVGASVLFLALLWGWQDVPGVAWRLTGPAAWLMHAIQLSGLALSALASRRLGVLELAGLRPVRKPPSRIPAPSSEAPQVTLERTGLYGIVRHPIYLAWVLMVWPAATMTGSRLVFAALSTAYLVMAIPLEERTLVRDFGDEYRSYQRAVRWRMVPGVY
jgi:protein-S-isoprenylcysteine O-methyltransferase Ste14